MIGALLVAVILVVFLSAWNRSFVAMGLDGWFPQLAERWQAGEVPYRDFFLPLPPLHLLEHSLLIRLFGSGLAVPRLVGTLGRALTGVFLFLWLIRIYRPSMALTAAAATSIVFSADISDSVFFYNHNSVFLAMIAAFAAATSLGRRHLAALSLAAIAGGASALCLLEKQTIGAALTVVLALLLFVLGSRRSALAFAAGWSLPTGWTVGWLISQDALQPFLSQVLFGGTSAKGPLLQVLLRPLIATAQFPWLSRPAILACLILIVLAAFARSIGRTRTTPTGPWALLSAGSAAIAAVLLGGASYPRSFRFVAIYVALFGSVVIAARLWRSYLAGQRDEVTSQRLFLAMVSVTVAYALSLSWPAWEPMVLPGLGFVLCEIERESSQRGGRATEMAILASALLIYGAAADKARTPYGWAEWIEPSAHVAGSRPTNTRLSGLRLSQSTSAFLDNIVGLVRQYSGPSDRVFVFPNLPIVYWLSERQPATFSPNHWFDVASDDISTAAAASLRNSPPAVLVDYEISETEWRTNESIFRGGKPCGQRILHQTLEELGGGPLYVKIAEMAAPISRNRVTIWARHDRVVPRTP